MSLRHCFINKKTMKTNHLFLLAIALISLLFTAYVIIAIISIAENPVWETVQTHLTTLPLALAVMCYLAKMADDIISEAKTSAGK